VHIPSPDRTEITLGIIAQQAATRTDTAGGWSNKVDRILADLDDEDRAIVLGWLTGGMGSRSVSADLADFDIVVSPDSIDRWRRAQRRGRGVTWARV
jgi:hypothetical protein